MSSASNKKWWPLGNIGTRAGARTRGGVGVHVEDEPELGGDCFEKGGKRLLIPTLAPFFPSRTRHAHALHVRLLSWFLDTPAAPFGVHRMALAVRAAGKDVGMWFGPSAAAGALRMLVEAFPACRLGVSVATDGTLYQTEVFAVSHSPAFAPSSPSVASVSSHGQSSPSHGSGSKKGKQSKKWGDWPVLLLLGIWLGGRPSSSYHIVIPLRRRTRRRPFLS
ncbi:hypothetical protein B0H13DRAFT_357975 [Mycena leptocephala]|nr:hypothetical protein B0H13DRAFT_357975 [Mycena leptocephala]